MNYVTLYQVRQYLKLAATETADDVLLARLIREVRQNIDTWCNRRFDVRQEARAFDYPIKPLSGFGVHSAEYFVYQMNAVAHLSSGRLFVDDDLLQVTTLTNGNGTVIAADKYVLEPANIYPKHAVILKRGGGVSWLPASDGTREQVISVAGLWGYHTRYGDQAWLSSLDTVQDNPLSAAATTLNVQDADGLDAGGESQRFQAGQMLRIDSEFIDVLAVDNTTNQLTIARGVNGTTAAQHTQGTAIYVYKPMENIVRAARRWVKYVYRQKDVDVMDAQQIIGTGIKITPAAMPADVRSLLPSPAGDRSGGSYL
jgi:hypothetical protein